jgi:maltodextrin utilization protein YvdJ
MKKVSCMVLGLLLVVYGCGKKVEEKMAEKITEKIIEHGTKGKAKVDLSDHSMTIETEKGKMVVASGKSAEIPADFPSDVLIFKPAEVSGTMAAGKGSSVMLKTAKDKAAVTSAYKEAMTKKGWTQKAAVDMGEQSILSYEKEKRVANVIISAKEGKTEIALTVTAK